jgi:hypothetical protein
MELCIRLYDRNDLFGSLIRFSLVNLHPDLVEKHMHLVCDMFKAPRLGLAYDGKNEMGADVVAAYSNSSQVIVVTPATTIGDLFHEIAHHVCESDDINPASDGSEQHGAGFCIVLALLFMHAERNIHELATLIVDGFNYKT